MECPICKNDKTKVVESRANLQGVLRRRRQCLGCDEKFTTYERHATDDELVNAKELKQFAEILSPAFLILRMRFPDMFAKEDSPMFSMDNLTRETRERLAQLIPGCDD